MIICPVEKCDFGLTDIMACFSDANERRDVGV